jgi:hypothetical protein
MPRLSKGMIKAANRLQVLCCKYRKQMSKDGGDINNVRRYMGDHTWKCLLCGKIEE